MDDKLVIETTDESTTFTVFGKSKKDFIDAITTHLDHTLVEGDHQTMITMTNLSKNTLTTTSGYLCGESFMLETATTPCKTIEDSRKVFARLADSLNLYSDKNEDHHSLKIGNLKDNTVIINNPKDQTEVK